MSIRAQFTLKRGTFQLEADLDLPGRGVSALFGASGAGKSTLLRLIAGLEFAPGVLEVNGLVWQDSSRAWFVPVHRRALGFVFQDANLFAHLSLRRNIEYGLRRIPVAQRHADMEFIIRLLGLEHLLDRYPMHLSGGERQRGAIARALLTSPQILLLDEPLAALDHARKQEVLPYLERLQGELDLPILYVSHAQDEVARLAHYLVVLEHGRVVACGPIADTLTRLDVPVRLGEDAGVVLVGKLTNRDPKWHLAQVTCADGVALWVRDGGQDLGQSVRLRILARDVSLALAPAPGANSILNFVPATVLELGADAHPALVLVRLALGGTVHILARLTKRSVATLNIQPDMAIWAQIKAAAVI
ncbi:molybdenum ABC transporter ATP-binding protein [Achromatium sp. WMS2]|nr:molybdenum ABC transporter ATP-binding protein [Achromatium sp. WMS2]